MALAAIIPYITAASAVIGAVGAYQQGQAAKAAADFNSQVASQNAGIATSQAEAQAAQIDREKMLRLGAIRAAAGAGGGTTAGSVLDVIGDTAAQYTLQKQQALYQGQLNARGYRNTAALDTASGKSAATTGKLKAASTLLSGGSTAAGQFQRLG